MARAQLFWMAIVLAACGGGDGNNASSSSGAGTTTSVGAGGSSASSGGGATTTTGSGGTGGEGGQPVRCPAQALDPGEHAMTISFDGNERDYEVQVPASYDNLSAVPLVFDLHGYTESANTQQGKSGWQELAEAQGFAVVRPDGSGILKSWNGGDVCCGSAQSQNLDDVGLMKAIVTEVSAQLCIDPKRIYASGLSNGGALSHRLACEAADVFAAVAPVSYPLDFNPNSQCQPQRPITVIHSHGTNDFTVPYNGGLTAQSAGDSFDYWGQVNGCSGQPVETFSMGNSHCDTFTNCEAGVVVTLCTISGGHQLYSNNDNVPIAAMSWDVLSQHTLP